MVRAVKRSVPRLVLALVAVSAAVQLLLPPVVGTADQGDYDRIMFPVGLAHVGTSYEDTVFLWVQQHYRVVPADRSRLVLSSELLFAGIARGLDAALTRDDRFDLRVLGAVHLVAYLAALWFLLSAASTLSAGARAGVYLGVLLAAADVVHVAYLNSFYSQPAALIFLVAWLGVALRAVRAGTPGRWELVAYFASVALFVATRAQNYVLAFPLAALPVALLASTAWRPRAAWIVPLAGVVLVWAGFLFASLPDWLRYPARWNGVFFGALVDSPSPGQDLAEFGLGPEWARWVGVDGIKVDGGSIQPPTMEVGAKIGFGRIARFYLKNPGRLVRLAGRCAERAWMWRDPRIGNYTRDSGRPASAHAPSYTGWSDLESNVFPKRLWFLVASFAVFLGVCAWELRHGLDTPAGRTSLLSLTVAASAMLAFTVLVVAGGLEDAVVDLNQFLVLFDACLVCAMAWVGTRLAPLFPSTGRERAPAAVSQ